MGLVDTKSNLILLLVFTVVISVLYELWESTKPKPSPPLADVELPDLPPFIFTMTEAKIDSMRIGLKIGAILSLILGLIIITVGIIMGNENLTFIQAIDMGTYFLANGLLTGGFIGAYIGANIDIIRRIVNGAIMGVLIGTSIWGIYHGLQDIVSAVFIGAIVGGLFGPMVWAWWVNNGTIWVIGELCFMVICIIFLHNGGESIIGRALIISVMYAVKEVGKEILKANILKLKYLMLFIIFIMREAGKEIMLKLKRV